MVSSLTSMSLGHNAWQSAV